MEDILRSLNKLAKFAERNFHILSKQNGRRESVCILLSWRPDGLRAGAHASREKTHCCHINKVEQKDKTKESRFIATFQDVLRYFPECYAFC